MDYRNVALHQAFQINQAVNIRYYQQMDSSPTHAAATIFKVNKFNYRVNVDLVMQQREI